MRPVLPYPLITHPASSLARNANLLPATSLTPDHESCFQVAWYAPVSEKQHSQIHLNQLIMHHFGITCPCAFLNHISQHAKADEHLAHLFRLYPCLVATGRQLSATMLFSRYHLVP